MLVSPEVSASATSLNVIPLVIGVDPINTLKNPPAPLKLETTPSLSAETTWAGLVKNVVIASEPDLIPKIVTESDAFKSPPLPSLRKTVTVVVVPAVGSFESGKLKVAEPFPEAVDVAETSLPPLIEKV